MGSLTFDFLTNSFLFNDISIEDNFRTVSEEELVNELRRYREFCLSYQSEIQDEAESNKSSLKMVSGIKMPGLKLLKQSAFYVEQYVINDPIFSFSYRSGEISQTFKRYVGLEKESLDKTDLARIARYMKSLTPMVAADYVKFLPIDYALEPPEQLPILYSEKLFSDILPESLFEFFRKRVLIESVERIPGNPYLFQLHPLKPCREILIRFEKHTNSGYGYFLHNVEDFQILDAETDEYRMVMHLPDEPPGREQFANWINQSFHLACSRFYQEICWRNLVADKCKASYLCESQFVLDFLNQFFSVRNDISTNTANVLLSMELPFLEQIDTSALMNIRLNYGEEFQNFRLHLDKQLKDLRLIEDPEQLRIKAENALHEITEIQIQAIKQKVEQFNKTRILDAIVLVGSLFASVHTGEWGITALAAGARGYKPFIDSSSQIRQNPAFFLWKVLQSSK